MNYHETRAMELLEKNSLVDAAMYYIDSIEDYFVKGDLISLSRVHLKLGFVSEELGMLKLAESSFRTAAQLTESFADKNVSCALWAAKAYETYAKFLDRHDYLFKAFDAIHRALNFLDFQLARLRHEPSSDSYSDEAELRRVLDVADSCLHFFNSLKKLLEMN